MPTHTRTPREQVEAIAAQIGSSLMPDNDKWTNRFKVESTSSSSMHTVAQLKQDYGLLPAGTWGCSCRGWTMHVDAQGRRKCRHLEPLLEKLAAVAATAQVELDAAVVQMLKSARTAYLDLGGGAAGAVKRRAGAGRQIDL